MPPGALDEQGLLYDTVALEDDFKVAEHLDKPWRVAFLIIKTFNL